MEGVGSLICRCVWLMPTFFCLISANGCQRWVHVPTDYHGATHMGKKREGYSCDNIIQVPMDFQGCFLGPADQHCSPKQLFWKHLDLGVGVSFVCGAGTLSGSQWHWDLILPEQ